MRMCGGGRGVRRMGLRGEAMSRIHMGSVLVSLVGCTRRLDLLKGQHQSSRRTHQADPTPHKHTITSPLPTLP